MISPLTPRQAAELLLAASLRTGGMTQEEWLATLGGPGSGNFGHAGRPGEVGGSSSDSGGPSLAADKSTGAAPTPELAAQSAKGIAACEKLLDTAIAEAKYGRSTASASTDWSQVDPDIQEEVENSLRNDVIERLEDDPDILNLSSLNRGFKEYLRTDEERVKELTESAAEAVKAQWESEGLGEISTQAILDNLTIGDVDEAPALGGDAVVKFENGDLLTEDQIEKLADSWDQAYAAEESSAFDNRDSDDWYQEAYSDLQKDYVSDAMSEVDDIERFDRAHALGYDDDQLFVTGMEPGAPTQWLTGTREPETPEDQENYDRTTAIVREMAFQRSQEIAEERGITPPTKEDIKDIWYSWKGSSQGMKAREFQQAVADELGGVTRFTDLQADDLRNRSDFGRMKAYVRGQWETNQWLMSKAGEDYIDVYRGVLIPTADIQSSTIVHHEIPGITDNQYAELPRISLQRNGAQSTTSDPDVANAWGGVGTIPTVPSERVVLRIRAPRTSVISLPVYGDNEASESETVLAGTRDRWWWDLWRSRAPEFNVHPPKPVHRAAALGPNGEIVIDFFEIDQQYPEHWLSRKERRLGGNGSGNFGHSGRPGEVGGSGPGEGGSSVISGQALRKRYASKLADVAQKVYDGWDESNVDEFAGGGICHLIAEDIASELGSNGIEATTVSSEIGEQHVWVVAKLEDGVYNIDIPPGVYERGGGYTWSKIEGVQFSPEDIIIERIDPDPESFENYVAMRAMGGKGSGNFGHAGRKGEVGGSAPGEGGGDDLPQEAVRHIVEGWQESYETVIEFREISKGAQKETEEFRQFKKAISSLPREKGPTYRGFQATDLSQFEEGAEVDIDAFASSTKDYSGAEFYARRDHDELLKEALFNNEPTSPVIMVFKGGSQFKAKLPDISVYADMKEVIIEPSKWRIKTSHDVYPSGKKLREVILVPR